MASDHPIKMGVLLWSQAVSWNEFKCAAQRVDRLGYEHLWTWDHLLPIFGDRDQSILEGWSLLSALATITKKVDIGLLVTANTFRNPAIVAKAVATIDHISGGRCLLGLGAAWFEPEHDAYGIEFGRGASERLDWLEESAGLIRALLDGRTVDHAGPRYHARELTLSPTPLRGRVPILIGGVGERKTLRSVARHADMWNAYGTVEELRYKVEVLLRHCEQEGRDPASIELSVACKPFIRDDERAAERVLARGLAQNRTQRADVSDDPSFWVGTPDQIAERMLVLRSAGFTTFIAQLPAPYDEETLERLIGEVKPMVEAG
jgi:alkanesulfonate monooxygenase SsuD/methylene tetrahydromethanopterin reductase-like flavin-dependent oxidoreductase (luciferase family)